MKRLFMICNVPIDSNDIQRIFLITKTDYLMHYEMLT